MGNYTHTSFTKCVANLLHDVCRGRKKHGDDLAVLACRAGSPAFQKLAGRWSVASQQAITAGAYFHIFRPYFLLHLGYGCLPSLPSPPLARAPMPSRSSGVHRSAPPSAAEVVTAVPSASPREELPGNSFPPGGEWRQPPGAPVGSDQGVGRVQGLLERTRVWRRRGRRGRGWQEGRRGRRQEEGGGEGVRAGWRDAAGWRDSAGHRVGAEGLRPEGLRAEGLRSQGVGAAHAGGCPGGVVAAFARGEACSFRPGGGEERRAQEYDGIQDFPRVCSGCYSAADCRNGDARRLLQASCSRLVRGSLIERSALLAVRPVGGGTARTEAGDFFQLLLRATHKSIACPAGLM